MFAKRLGSYILALQEQGGLTWENAVRIEINGKEYELDDYMGFQMPDNNPEHWYYLLRAAVPPPGKTIDWSAVEDKIRNWIRNEYNRANAMITDAALEHSFGGQITMIDAEKSTNAFIEFVRKELKM